MAEKPSSAARVVRDFLDFRPGFVNLCDSMKIALFALALFTASFLFHWLLWRIRLPKRQTFALLQIYFGALPVAFALSFLPAIAAHAPNGFWEWLHVTLSQTALALMYTANYSALEGVSPTCMLALYTEAAGAQGCSHAELRTLAEQSGATRDRLDALYRDGLAVDENGRTQLTPKGLAWAKTARFFRALLGLPKGG